MYELEISFKDIDWICFSIQNDQKEGVLKNARNNNISLFA